MLRPPALLLAALMSVPLSLRADPNPAADRPPAPERHPKDVTVHGDHRTDDYFWLREKDNPEVRAYLERENAYTEEVLAPQKALRDRLYREMRGRIKEDDTGAKTPFRGYLYYSRTEKDKQYAIYCRQKDSPGAPEEILLDLNVLGQGKPYIALGGYHVSDDGRRLAYSVDWTGYRQYEVFVMDLATHQLVAQQVGKVSEFTWGSPDVIYYVTENDAKRSDQLHRWTLGSARGELLYTEPDVLYNLTLSRSRDGRYVFCEAFSKLTTEVRALRTDQPAAVPVILRPRSGEHEYHADYRDGRFYFVSNEGAKNYRIMTAPEAQPASWTELVPHRPAVKVDTIELFAAAMVIHERENGLPHLAVYDFAAHGMKRLEMPDEVYEISADQNWEDGAREYRFRYQSLARPVSVFASSFATGERRLVKETEVLGGFDARNYVTRRQWVPARDGTLIPVSIVYRRDLDRSKPQPLLLYGYGSYGISVPISFSSSRVSLLDRGVIYAIAHIRGGGELGEEWREAGRMERKMTTFTDFVDCGQWLVDHGWTTSDRMACSGGSAGGLLMGAVVNLRPDLFRAVQLQVPFVDVLNTMLDASLPLTTEEYVEWGNPNVPAEYRWMRAYSPYDNLRPAAYPNMLANVSFFDSQVPYWEGAKFLAKARTLNSAPTSLLLETNFDAGHGGASGRFDALKNTARDYTFLLTALGIRE